MGASEASLAAASRIVWVVLASECERRVLMVVMELVRVMAFRRRERSLSGPLNARIASIALSSFCWKRKRMSFAMSLLFLVLMT